MLLCVVLVSVIVTVDDCFDDIVRQGGIWGKQFVLRELPFLLEHIRKYSS